MHPFYKEFVEHLDRVEREWCVDKVTSMLSTGNIDIATLYEEVLAPALRDIAPAPGFKRAPVWKEHERTSVVRTVVECCYPFVMKERRAKHGDAEGPKVVIACPTEEAHDIGARMVADLFTLCGFQVTYFGASTPVEDIVESIEAIRPKFVGLSVTNIYNLAAVRRTIELIVALRRKEGLDLRILVGGNAFERNPGLGKEMGADECLSDMDDIKALREVK